MWNRKPSNKEASHVTEPTQGSIDSASHFTVRAFERREVADAIAWAQEGKIALHFFRWSHPRFGTGEYCHILCADHTRLIAFGAAFGFMPMQLQPPRRGRGVWHYDAWGWRVLALRRLAATLPTQGGE